MLSKFQVKSLRMCEGAGGLENFLEEAMEKPSRDCLKVGIKTLIDVGAIEGSEKADKFELKAL